MELSPLVHKHEIISENVVALLNTVTLKKFYCSTELFNKIKNWLKKNEETPLITKLIDAGFVTKKPIDIEKIFEKISADFPSTPEIISSYIILTDKCNFRCKYCFLKDALSGRYSMDKKLADKVIKVIEKNASRTKPYQIMFYGGEALLNAEIMFYIIEKLSAIKDITFNFAVNTNGVLVTEELAKEFKSHNLSACVSLDGWPEINDKERVYINGLGTGYDVLKGISLLKKESVPVTISCTIGAHNYLYLPEIVKFVRDLGATAIGFNLLLGKQTKRIDPANLAFFYYHAFKAAQKFGIEEDRVDRRRYRHMLKEAPRVNDCVGAGEQIYFAPDGRIGPCHAFYPFKKYHRSISKISDTWLAKDDSIWKEWCKRSPFNMPQCYECSAISVCGGGCPFNAFTNHGSIWKIDDYNCKFMKTLLNYLIRHDYYENILKVKIDKLSVSDLKNFETFFEELYKISGKGLGFDKVLKKHGIMVWAIKGVNANEYAQNFYFVAKAKERIVGYCMGYVKEKQHQIGLGALPDYAETAIPRLFNYASAEAKRLGWPNLYLPVSKRETKTIDFFKKSNFELIKETKDKLYFRTNL